MQLQKEENKNIIITCDVYNKLSNDKLLHEYDVEIVQKYFQEENAKIIKI